jgi:hypothetical protein
MVFTLFALGLARISSALRLQFFSPTVEVYNL